MACTWVAANTPSPRRPVLVASWRFLPRVTFPASLRSRNRVSRTGLGTPSLDGVRPTLSPQAWEALRSPEGSTRGSRAEVLARSDGGGGSGHVPLATPASAPTIMMSRGAVNKRPFHEVSPSIRMLPASTKSMCFLVDSESDSEGEGVSHPPNQLYYLGPPPPR